MSVVEHGVLRRVGGERRRAGQPPRGDSSEPLTPATTGIFFIGVPPSPVDSTRQPDLATGLAGTGLGHLPPGLMAWNGN
jgi:hypothetical protein